MSFSYNFSVIIPHKNAADLLLRCLHSIPERPDLQVVVVDDNSDMVSVQKLKEINRKNCIVVYNDVSKGAGYARNCGLAVAEGRWILFADSDDFYESSLNQFLNENLESAADCIYFSVNSANSKTLEPGWRNFLYDEYIKRYNPHVLHSEDWILFHKWEPWNKMISRRLIDEYNIRFDEISKCNDMMFNIMVSFFAKKIKILPDHIYCVTYNDNSMTFRATKPEEFRDCLFAFKKKNVIMHKIGHWIWHMPMLIQHRHFILKEGLHQYLKLLKFYLMNYPSMWKEVCSFKKKLKKVHMVPKECLLE